MSETRWVRVQVPATLHSRVRLEKARQDVTWEHIVQEGIELWLDAVAVNPAGEFDDEK